jgi:SAM-dependent methyltransferase
VYKKNPSTPPESEQDQWFSVWFNTPYYHLLYNNRNPEEAESFIRLLTKFLNPEPGCKALDLACGSGRHSVMLNKLGFDVLGIDLAQNSIEEARTFENEHLHFAVGDMREVVYQDHFDYIFNLFTSFGYFGSADNDREVLLACHKQLKHGGILVLDYFNVENILPMLPYCGSEKRGQLTFEIAKELVGKQIVKKIDFMSEGKTCHYEERVTAYSKHDLESMFIRCGFEIETTFGNYSLEPFHKKSDRVIIIASKK